MPWTRRLRCPTERVQTSNRVALKAKARRRYGVQYGNGGIGFVAPKRNVGSLILLYHSVATTNLIAVFSSTTSP